MEILKGDILLVHSKNITGKVIQFGMNVEQWRLLNFMPLWKKIYNHAAICIEDGIIAEALKEGIVIHNFDEVYKNKKGKELCIYRPKWKKEELELLKPISESYKGVNYQFVNFIQYIPKILLGIWLGRKEKNSENKLYCTEFVSLVIHRITHGKYFKKYWKSSPTDVKIWCDNNTKYIKTYILI